MVTLLSLLTSEIQGNLSTARTTTALRATRANFRDNQLVDGLIAEVLEQIQTSVEKIEKTMRTAPAVQSTEYISIARLSVEETQVLVAGVAHQGEDLIAQVLLTGLTLVTINYKDHADVNQTANLAAAATSITKTWRKGLMTTT